MNCHGTCARGHDAIGGERRVRVASSIMLYDIHTGNPLDVPPLTQAFIATAEPYAVTEAQALKMLDGRAPGKHTFAEITEAARKHANTDLFHRGPSGRVFVRVGREFHAVGVGKSNGARLSTSSRKANPAAKVRWRVMQGGHTLASGYATSSPKARAAAGREARKKAVREAGRKAARSTAWTEGFHVEVSGHTRYPLATNARLRIWS
jgi:hypothetical protein